MKKYVQNFWMRFLACILCSVTIVTGVVAGVLIAGVTVGNTKKEVYKNGQEYIAENYAAYIYDHIYEGDGNVEEDVELIENFLADKNFTCSISKVTGGNIGTEMKEEPLIYNNLVDLNDWDYEFNITEGSYVNYDVDTALNALRVGTIIHEYFYTEEVSITGYFFEEATGLFYYQAGEYYFLADYVKVSYGGNYYDYRLKNSEDGKRIYYNSYYDVSLDTNTYREWDWVELNGHKLVFAIENHAVSNEISIVTDDTIQNHLYTGIYQEYYHSDIISYYPERSEDVYVIRIKLDDLTHVERVSDDMFTEWKLLSDAFYENEGSYQAVLVLSIILFLVSFALLIYSAKNKKEELETWNKLPVGCFTIAWILMEFVFVEAMIVLVDYGWSGANMLPLNLVVTLFVLCIFGAAFFAFLWLQNVITRFKTRTFIRYSELYYGLQLLKWSWTKWKWIWYKVTSPFRTMYELARENIKLFTKGLVIMLVIGFAEFMAIVLFRWEIDIFIWLFLLEKLLEILVVSFVLLQMQKLQEGSKRIAAGDLSEPIDTSKMLWEFKKHGENINKVGDGIAFAVEDRMKSERFKTELITNVSHDIKTPLTSIINYVDLIKKEEIQDETLQEYVDVLDRQSARLKKLIEDLMEASKASTGNMAVNMEECDVEVLLTQLIGEFEEKLTANQLEVVVQKPEHPVLVSADGRHLWRVLDNLLNNACKYSLSGTRVYVSLVQVGYEATITFKNISKAALNIPSDELMERFVRGDSSRNTEGSGLGLSIAQSLTELMKGSMKLEIDGDLFKVTLKFKAIRK